MGKVLLKKLKEAAVSVLPVAFIVLILSLTPVARLAGAEIAAFAVCAVLAVAGIALFNLGADLAMTPMGEQVGSGLTRSKSLWILLAVCFVLGVLITVAEPDLSVLAEQVREIVNETALIVIVGMGVGLFLILAILKMAFKPPLSALLLFFYFLLFALSSLVLISGNEEFLALSFDAGGVTTGPITVPFLMALGVGVASTLGGKHSNENSFGIIALCSVGPVLAVMVLGVFANGSIAYEVADYAVPFGGQILQTILTTAREVGVALGLIVAVFIVLQLVFLKLPKKKIEQIAVGIVYTFFGLVVFLTAVKIGFMPVGFRLGAALAASPVLLRFFGFVLGMVTVLAEPAVHVLNKQVEEITEGTVSKRSMIVALSLGVGISIGLSMLRIVFHFNVLYYLIPGYFLSLGLSFFVPGLYTAIAFDSGGVASGPLTSGFILPLAIGACMTLQGESAVLMDAFGVVAMVAMTPLITIQFLGFRAITAKRVSEKIMMKRILDAGDEQIIKFM
ncbi:MAG: DUF1538 domain-containing protein [Clostridia bacterium]|nr:DUF1538 domain-containing protein [Clostridia bacterium]